MLIRVDPESTSPLFAQVATSVRVEVALGRLAAGDRLPPASEVARALDVNVHTVLHAYQELRDEGLLDLRRGRGATITQAAGRLTELRDEIAALVERARALGVSADTLAALIKETKETKETL